MITITDIDLITGEIVDAALKLHIRLGPGLFESVYEKMLAQQLGCRGLSVERQKVVPLDLDGLHFEEAFRVDLLVQGLVVVEVKSLEKLAPVHSKQVFTYIRLLNVPVGLLLNFGAPRLKDGCTGSSTATGLRGLIPRFAPPREIIPFSNAGVRSDTIDRPPAQTFARSARTWSSRSVRMNGFARN